MIVGAMRRASAFLVASMAVALLSASVAAATPVVHFRAEPVPIKGYKHTGYIYGAGTALQAEYQISGKEYFEAPPPLIGVHFYLPAGAEVHPKGFPTCAKATLERTGSAECPSGSAAGPVGHANGVVSFGGERVEETTTVESFYSASGGLEFFTVGHSPTSLEILSSGHYLNLHGAGGFGLEFVAEIPLVPTVPGAPYASVENISIEAGSAIMMHGKPLYYGTVPRSCPKAGFSVKSEMIFDEGGATPPVPEIVTVAYKAPCPRR